MTVGECKFADFLSVLLGTAEPVGELDEWVEVSAAQDADVPVNEKGDEPLSHHQEEILEQTYHEASQDEGLSTFQKIGALAVIVAVCIIFIRTTAGARSPSKSAYEKSLA